MEELTLTPEIIASLKEAHTDGLPLLRTPDPYLLVQGVKKRNTADGVIQGLPFPVVYKGLTSDEATEAFQSVEPEDYPDQQELQDAYAKSVVLAAVVWPESIQEVFDEHQDQIGFKVTETLANKVRLASGELLNPTLVEDLPISPEGWEPPAPELIKGIREENPTKLLNRWSYRGYHFLYTCVSGREFDSLPQNVQAEIQFTMERQGMGIYPSRLAMLAFVEKQILYPDKVDWDNLPYGYLYQVVRAIYAASGFQVETLGVNQDMEL